MVFLHRKRPEEEADTTERGLSPSIKDLRITPDPYRSDLYSAQNRPDNVSKFDVNDNRRCQLCRYHIDDLYRESALCGRLLPVQSEGVRRGRECEWVHSKCALASTDIDTSHCDAAGDGVVRIECHRFNADFECLEEIGREA